MALSPPALRAEGGTFSYSSQSQTHAILPGAEFTTETVSGPRVLVEALVVGNTNSLERVYTDKKGTMEKIKGCVLEYKMRRILQAPEGPLSETRDQRAVKS